MFPLAIIIIPILNSKDLQKYKEEDGKPPAQIALDRAAYLLDVAALGFKGVECNEWMILDWIYFEFDRTGIFSIL